MVEVRLVAIRPGKWSTGVTAAEAEMQELYKQSFLMMRADVIQDTIVYVFTRTVTPGS
jgi:hypothetical protein